MDTILDELVTAREYGEALALLEDANDRALPDKVGRHLLSSSAGLLALKDVSPQEKRRTLLKSLQAVSAFQESPQQSIETFISLDITPSKVIALFPSAISGQLAATEDSWIALFGGPDADRDPVRPDAEPATAHDGILSSLVSIGTGARKSEVADDDPAAKSGGQTRAKTSALFMSCAHPPQLTQVLDQARCTRPFSTICPIAGRRSSAPSRCCRQRRSLP